MIPSNLPTNGQFPQRPYGPNAIPLSIIGFGGIVVMNAEQPHANRTVARAVEMGINYFDVAPSYGNSEEKLGPALQPHRKHCFLACKTAHREAAPAQAELAQSLACLHTDYFDLYQLHALADLQKDVDVAFAKGGAMEVLLAAKRSGQIRHLGFSAHSVEAALTAMDRCPFDSILFPVNFATFYRGNFGPTVLAHARAKGVTVLALKALARQKWPADAPERPRFSKCWYQPLSDPREQELALRFTLSQSITAAVSPSEEELFWRATEIARTFQPLTAAETQEVQALAATMDPVFTA